MVCSQQALNIPQVLNLKAGATGYVQYNAGSGVVTVVASGIVSAIPVTIAGITANLLAVPATLTYTNGPGAKQFLTATIFTSAGNVIITDDFVSGVKVGGTGFVGGVAGAVNTLKDAGAAIKTGAETVINKVGDGFKSLGNTIASWFQGPLVGAQVYFDASNNFDFAHDPSAVTAADGTSPILVPAGATGGQLVLIGGTDSASGVVNPMVLTAPYDATSVNPLTTLINDIMQQDGLDEATATVYVNTALGLSPDTDQGLEESLVDALGGDQAAGNDYAAGVEVYWVANAITQLLSGQPGAPSTTTLSESAFNAIATDIAAEPGAPLILSSVAGLQALIQQVATGAGLTVDPTVASDTAQILSALIQDAAAITNDGSSNYIDEVTLVDIVANGAVAPKLALVASGGADIATLLADYTGSALAAAIGGGTVGILYADSPAVSITTSVEQPVGAGDPATMVFPVYLTTNSPLTAPVTVQYTTVDETATAAHGDYTPTSGTLTWDPGDTAPKLITVPVNATNGTTPDLAFGVVLSNPQNATTQFGAAAVGVIEYTDYTTTTTLTSSNPSPTFGDAVTLTAAVTNQDPAMSPGTGTVTFQLADGTVLGTATLASGQASITTTDLPAGSDSVTAVYSSDFTGPANYAPSTSQALSETVAQAPQTITFGALANQTYGAEPFNLGATTSSGLGVNYQIVSGPATLDFDELTITGTGTVVVEATQIGEPGFRSRPAGHAILRGQPRSLDVHCRRSVDGVRRSGPRADRVV